MEYSISLNNLGEFRMGVIGYGISIEYKGETLDFLSDKIIFANSEEPKIDNFIDEMKNDPILVIKGEFSTFLVNLETEEASLFKHTVRTEDGAWSEECPIFGQEAYHFNGMSGKHYYVQFPFVKHLKFWETVNSYDRLRSDQIQQAKNAT